MSAAAAGAAPDAGARLPLSRAFLALCGTTLGLIVLGALVRVHDAGLACPDWPLCFGRLLPRMDLQVAFEWTHRLVALGVSLGFAGLALAALGAPGARARVGRPLAAGAALLAGQILLGALTVWLKLAAWTVTAHLLTGNGFAIALLWIALALREPAGDPATSSGGRRTLALAALLLSLQMALGGLVASGYAGLACPEWPACSGGVWFPSWRGSVGIHLLHRWNAVALLVALAASWRAARGTRAARPAALALGLGLLQGAVGIANVLLGLPVEVTGLHSALAAGLSLSVSVAVRRTGWRA